MLKMIQRGDYKLFEGVEGKKVLLLDDTKFLWADATLSKDTSSENNHALLASGKYRLYEIEKEPSLSDTFHLELSVGCGNWQGYILPEGLPENNNDKNHINTTTEVITKTNGCSECKCGC